MKTVLSKQDAIDKSKKPIDGMNMKKIKMSFILCLVSLPIMMQAQTLSPADTLVLFKAQNDTMQLRRIARNRFGDRVGAKAQHRIAQIAYDKGDYKKAEEEYLSIRKQYLNFPESNSAMYWLGRAKFKQGEYSKAQEYLKEYIKAEPTGEGAEKAKFYYLQGMEETKDPAYVDSVRSYFTSPRRVMGDKDPMVHYGLVRYYGRQGNIGQALEESKTLITKYPKSKYANFAESRVVDYYCIMGKSEEAIKFCQSLLKKYPPNSEEAARAHRMLGSMYMNTNQFERARKEYEEQIKQGEARSPRVMKAEYALIIVDVRQGQKNNDTTMLENAMEKLRTFAQTYSQDPWSSRAWMDIADLSMQNFDKQTAIEAYNKVIAYDSASLARGEVSHHSNMYLEQLSRLKQAHLSKGMLLQESKEALAEFESVLTMDSTDTNAMLNKARCLKELGNTEEAKTILRKLVRAQRDVQAPAKEMMERIEKEKGAER
ncbi:MAG TPA: tetratricopeptide repeat protein [Bacteroidota bacterium]|jgi:tetratricopeptide (TPR) repeat protein|nr:tetratricopeptide repeat protein [Bacteroidota bacterium]